MTEDTIVNVWNEVRLTADGISITLFSETATGGAIVEDELWYTFEELQEQSPNPPQSLNLSPETRSKLSEQSEDRGFASMDEVLSSVEPEGLPLSEAKEIVEDAQSDTLPDVGDILRDENAADWSDERRVEVLNVLEDVNCNKYVIQSDEDHRINTEVDEPKLLEKTVADANPSYDQHDPVVIARYLDSNKEYAFPASRLQ